MTRGSAQAVRSPLSGLPLALDTPHSLACAGERWPVVDGIPYLRTGREPLVAAALEQLDGGDSDAALVTLLADQDDWWTGPATDPGELERLVRGRDTLSLREAMALLRLGPVADYFAYRWVDPTYLAGLALLEAHWRAPASAFELACGVGHYLRELTRRGVACTGADIVFAKCWLAKRWVAPDATYLVFDAAAAWPVTDVRFDLVMCHDAFYFLADQPAVARRLRALLGGRGVLAVSHVHNSAFHRGARGPARAAAEWAALFPDAFVYDEADLLDAFMRQASPEPGGWIVPHDEAVEAWSLVESEQPAGCVAHGLTMPPADVALRTNPLLGSEGPRWPNDRWRAEYGGRCLWAGAAGASPTSDPVRLRRLVDLPERW